VIPIVATVLNLTLAVFLFFYRPLGVWVCIGYLLLGIFLYYVYSRHKEFKAKAEPLVHVEQPVCALEPSDYHILVPLANDQTAAQLQRFAIRMAKANKGDITALHVIRVPAQLPPSEGRKYLNEAKVLIDKAVRLAEEDDIPVCSLVKLSHNVPKAIIETCNQRKIDLMVIGWEGEIPARDRVFGTILDEIIQNTVCDIAMVCRAPEEEVPVERILIPVSNVRYAQLSLKVAEALTPDSNTPIDLFHATPYDDMKGIRSRIQEDLDKLAGTIDPERYTIIIRKTHRVAEAILEETKHHDMIIMGAPEEGLVRRAVFGDLPALVARNIDGPLILTKRYTGHVKSWFQKFFGSRKTMLD
jgi:nucleotide-binding universal stress UspA family protein